MLIEQKNTAIHDIKKVISGGKHSTEKIAQIESIILDLLTTRSSYFREKMRGSSPVDLQERYQIQADWYKKQQSIWENSAQGKGNPGWIQLDCHKENEREHHPVHIKIYRTIPENEYTFIQHLPSLKDILEKLGRQTHDSISLKFPRGLIGFLKHPDSLVIHFQKTENIDRINSILADWMTMHNITKGMREGGRTELAADHSGKSFSELIAGQFAYSILQNTENLSDLLDNALRTSQKPNFTKK